MRSKIGIAMSMVFFLLYEALARKWRRYCPGAIRSTRRKARCIGSARAKPQAAATPAAQEHDERAGHRQRHVAPAVLLDELQRQVDAGPVSASRKAPVQTDATRRARRAVRRIHRTSRTSRALSRVPSPPATISVSTGPVAWTRLRCATSPSPPEETRRSTHGAWREDARGRAWPQRQRCDESCHAARLD